jgi:hypothetical protein
MEVTWQQGVDTLAKVFFTRLLNNHVLPGLLI